MGHTYFLPLQAHGRSCRGLQFCSYTCHRQFIGWLKGNHLKVFQLGYVNLILSSGKSIESKTESVVVTVCWFKAFVGIIVGQIFTKAHLVNPL